ncbi:hypothetical protein V1L54_11070 [Streptomyces sp. TRM 70361]|uniref:hypothetical protein n=1 Tax=Streptomyces sp. TRM 70361 TaxID=3116553 RepID=UPI002E7B0F04|nr:hypothetical protein [Streptomyces sp. TRM 70361]MEE1939941.1 hypothetical protein [Streptomyces sp. TRM 70361]
MSSFGTHRARVHDPARPVQWRLSDLRSCVVRFAPYGFRATYHHLRTSAGIPRCPGRDPESLVRAVEELHAARLVWLTAETEYAERRAREKRAGRRRPAPGDTWRARQRGCDRIAYCPDPGRHPTEPLPVVVRRVLRGLPESPGPGDRPVCRVCGGPTATVSWSVGYWTHTLCAECGVSLRRE